MTRLCAIVAIVGAALVAAGQSLPDGLPAAGAPATVSATATAPSGTVIAARPTLGERASDPLDKPVAAAARYLLGRISPSGACVGEYPPGNPRYGGRTALCVQALLAAEADSRDPAIARAVEWLKGQKLTGTYAVAMRACATASLYRLWRNYERAESRAEADKLAPLIRQDVGWLIDAADKDGGYTYTSAGGKPRAAYDNSNSQMAVLGIWAGAGALDMDVPADFWKRVERHWATQQQADGGWGYLLPAGELRMRSYGSMTAAGLATLYICRDWLDRDLFVRCAAPADYAPIASAHKWLAAHYSPSDNPGKGVEWYYYWLYSLERVGQASGQKYIGEHDWHAKALPELLAQQNGDGSFGSADPPTETALALMFVARGRHPMLLSKLSYTGKWNCRPRDAANFAEWWSYTFERNVQWQSVRLDAAAAELRDAPILYVSGGGPIELGERAVELLRRFVNEGGTIVSEAAGNNADFTLDMLKLYKQLFPQYEPARLPNTHPIYALNYRPAGEAALTAVSNGPRLLAVHASNEMSLGLQMGANDAYRPVFEQMANICLYVTDRGTLRQRGADAWPRAMPFQPSATIRLTRVRYDGNYDPEPLALERLGMLMGNRGKVKVDLAGIVDVAVLDAAKNPIGVMTGTADFKLTAAQAEAIKKYFAAGGTLVIDAAGGARGFADAVEREIYPLAPEATAGLIAAEHPIYAGVKIAYRRELAASLDARDRSRGRLHGVQSGRRLAVIFSPDDITAGLVGYPSYGIRGYTPDTAAALMTSIVLHVAGIKVP